MQTPPKSAGRFWIPAILALLCLLPIATLFRYDAMGGWALNRSLMSEPDEPSYMLMTKSLLTGHGLSTAAITGRDTFYPPGLPLLLAGWSKIFGFSIASIHVCVVVTLSAAILLAYFLSRRIFQLWNWPHSHRPAIVVAALFATSWHTLENGLFIFSEPFFMAALFGWLLAALKTDRWWSRPRAAAVIAALACAAWLIRAAGVVCIAATLAYIVIGIVRRRKNRPPAESKARWFALVAAGVVVAAIVAVAGVLTSHPASPDAPDNSYTHQLFSRLGAHTFTAIWSHVRDFAAALIPEPWDKDEIQLWYFSWLGPLMLVFCVAGLICKFFKRGPAPTRFAEIFLLFYIALYLIWPFNITRFWIPILPLASAYAAHTIRNARPALKFSLPMLALVLNIEQLARLFPDRQERLAYVSDCLAESAALIRRECPVPQSAVICADSEDFFMFSWYLNPGLADSGYRVSSPAAGQRNEENIMKQFNRPDPIVTQVYVVSYFKHDPRSWGEPTMLYVLQNLQKKYPFFVASDPDLPGFHPTQDLPVDKGALIIQKLHQRWNVTAVWRIQDAIFVKDRH